MNAHNPTFYFPTHPWTVRIWSFGPDILQGGSQSTAFIESMMLAVTETRTVTIAFSCKFSPIFSLTALSSNVIFTWLLFPVLFCTKGMASCCQIKSLLRSTGFKFDTFYLIDFFSSYFKELFNVVHLLLYLNLYFSLFFWTGHGSLMMAINTSFLMSPFHWLRLGCSLNLLLYIFFMENKYLIISPSHFVNRDK